MNHIKVAVLQIGVSESPKGSNSGPIVDKYLKSVGLAPGFSWCMAFVYWCCKEANPNNILFRTGGVLKQWNKTAADHRHTVPLPGDIFVMDFGGGLGHTGFVENVVGDTIQTIEGNSNDEGSREGYEVCRRTRKISACKGFIRL